MAPTTTPCARFAGLLLLAGVAGATLSACQPAAEGPDPWWKGNLHTHTLWSDGDDFPEMVLAWYKDRGYHFAALSDHNTMAADSARWLPVGPAREAVLARYRERYGPDVETRRRGDTLEVRLKTLAEYRAALDEPGRFLVIPAEEITDRFERAPIHVNATNLRTFIPPQGGTSVADVIERNVEAVLAQRAATGQPMVPHLNHPNFGWAVTVEDLLAVEAERFFEVYNGHPAVHNEGDSLRPSTERMWDIVLTERLASGGDPLYGLAVDDAHSYADFDGRHANPGRGWIMVQAPELTATALIAALEAGHFYASTGVAFDRVEAGPDGLALQIQPEEGVTYTTRFIGTREGYTPPQPLAPDTTVAGAYTRFVYGADVGVVLAEVDGTTPSYTFTGDELYVRAQVMSSKPKANPYRAGEVERAWTQPAVPPGGRTDPR